MAKKDSRGRKPKMHDPVPASFDEVLGAVAKSKYSPKKKTTRAKK
jgi:hypothetical protein